MQAKRVGLISYRRQQLRTNYMKYNLLYFPTASQIRSPIHSITGGQFTTLLSLPTERLCTMINGTQIDEMSTNSTDRPFAPGDLQRSVETYTGNNRNIRR